MKKMYSLCILFLLASYLPFLNQGTLITNGYIFLIIGLSLWQQRVRRTLGSFLKLAVLMGGAALIFNEHGSLWGLEPGVTFLTLLAALKTFELKSPRDFFIFVLIVELSLSAHVLTVDALYMVIYVLALSLGLFALLFTFHTEGVDRPWSAQRRKVFIKIFLLSIPMAFCLFMLFPRLTLGNFFFNTIKKVNYTGFTDHVNPGAISQVIEDKTPFFRAKFFNGKTPSIYELYWRGAILSQTDGFSWKRGRTGEVEEERIVKPVKFSYSIDFDLFMNGPLFLLENGLSYEKKSRGYVLKLGGGTYKFYPYSNQKIKYTATTGKRIVKKLAPKMKESYLRLPEEEKFPRFRSWVRSLNLENTTLRQKLKVFAEYVKANDFAYSLRPGAISGPTPLDSFFFDKKLGLCEHYASALGVFLRLNSVPTRLVAGFHGGSLNPIGDYYLITGQDAHAWVEAWDDKKGWKRVDPTNWIVPERIRFGSEAYFAPTEAARTETMDIFLRRQNSQFFRRALFAFDMIYFELNREFVGFDIERQTELFSFLGVKNKNWPWKLIVLCGVVVALILTPLSYWLYRSSKSREPSDVLYQKFETLMKKYSLERESSEGANDFLARCQQSLPFASTPLADFTEVFLDIKYGGNTMLDAPRSLKKHLLRLKKVLKVSHKS